MNQLDDLSLSKFYQTSRPTTAISRPHTSLPSKNGSDMFKLGLVKRTQIEFPSKKRLIQHNVYIPTDERAVSPPVLYQPTSTPDLYSVVDQNALVPSIVPTPTPIKTAAFTIPIKSNSGETFLKNFPKQTHERRKITQERKRQKQLAQKNAHADADNWFRLRQSLAELTRLATTEEILVDPTTSLFNCDGYSFEALKQAIKEQQEQKKINRLKSESGMSTSMDTIRSRNIRSRTSLTVSRNSLSRSQLTRQSTEVYPRPIFEPLIVANKPLHPLFSTGNNHSTRTPTKQLRTPTSTPLRGLSLQSFSLQKERVQSVLSDLSNDYDDPPASLTPSPPLQNFKKEHEEIIITKIPRLILSDDQRPSSNLSLKSTIKLKSQIPRCRSANDAKHSFSLNKTYPKFILITDQEHRIESWYHQYSFIVGDELLQSFQTKPTKLIVSAYFIDDHQQQQHANLIQKSHLQGKPFHINNDWKKYDLIFISNNIYQDIMIYLQTIIKLSGKLIHIYQIHHNEDLKTQVRYISKQLKQQISSHI